MKKIRVLAITKEFGGSDFHRLTYPLSKINGFKGEDFEIDVDFQQLSEGFTMDNHDVLLYNWDIGLSIQQLGEIQSKGKKIIYVLDDTINIEENHPTYNNPFIRQYAQNRVKQHLLVADAVIVSNERVMLDVIKYNDNVAVLPNFLNPEDFKCEKVESDKLRVGIMGSASHINNFLALKGVINRIAKNKKLLENCEFYLCGYDGSEGWKQIESLFSCKKGLVYHVRNYEGLDKYFNSFSNLDVLLMPLLYTEFNACRTALKLNECACANVLPIGSRLYSQKELKGIVMAETPLEYEKALETCLDREQYNTLLNHITETNLKDADYNKRIENTIAVINTVYSEDLSFKLPNCNFYSIKYKEEQPVEYKEVFNVTKEKAWRFEYNVFLDKLSEIKEHNGYSGIFSWKLPLKTGLVKNILFKTLMYKSYEEYDFINLTPKNWKTTKEYIDFSEKQHPGLEKLLKKVVNNLGKEYKYDKKFYTYSNFFIMKSELYTDYIENWIIPSINYMENEIWEEVNVDANYTSHLSKEEFKELTGLDFYNYLTFILERMPSFYIYDKKLKCLDLM